MRKWALITGASGGIGQAIAKTLAQDGYNLYLHYNKGDMTQLTAILKQLDIEFKLVKADLSHSEGVYSLIEKITEPIDVIIHNAGSSFHGLITDMTDRQIQEMVQLHVTSPFILTKYLIPAMITKRSGKVIVISSVWGNVGASCEVLYSMVKGGQNTFVKALAKELAPSGINVNGIAPGSIDTGMLDIFSPEDKQLLIDEIPMGRLGKPDEVANAVSFLVSEKAAYINGEILSINGAWFS